MILDTNGLSALADGDPALEPILREADEVALPVVVLGEYRSRKRAPPSRDGHFDLGPGLKRLAW